ncbi:MAG: replication-relaxation family protein [Bdellovibrionales bacterium]|nr:replication-relaxation family protein [Bdellovibrionales bacterium]
MKGRLVINEHRDIPLLIYIWKWKIASTASLHYKFFKNLNPTTTYNRLTRLKLKGFIQIKFDIDGRKPVWMLDKKGFKVIRHILPDLKEEGYKSENITHDLLCSAIHLGDFLLEKPENVQIITEQQLRRYNLEDLPAWVPSKEIHRPDGYWHFEDGESGTTVALELERSRKSSTKIEKLVSFYSDFSRNFLVLWVLEGKGLQKRLIHNLEKASENSGIHNIVQLKDFLNKGWQSKILYGPHQNMTIADFICCKARAKLGPSQGQGLYQIILDHHLRYRNHLQTLISSKKSKVATE